MTIQASLLLPLDAAQAFDANVAAFTGDPDAYLVTRDRRGLDRDGDYQQAVTYRRYWPDGGYTVETRFYYWPR